MKAYAIRVGDLYYRSGESNLNSNPKIYWREPIGMFEVLMKKYKRGHLVKPRIVELEIQEV